MSSLNIALSVIFDTHVSVFTCSSAITSSLLLLLLSVLPGESDHVSYMTNKFSCPLYKVKCFLGSSLCLAHCSRIYPCIWLLSWFHHYLIWVSFVSTFLYPVPSHSCDPLEDLFPSLSQYGFPSALPDDEDLEFWRSYLWIHFHHWWTPLLQLSIITYWLTNYWILSMFVFSFPCSHGLDCTGSLGSFMKTLVPLLWTKLCQIMIFEDSSLLYCGFDPPL